MQRPTRIERVRATSDRRARIRIRFGAADWREYESVDEIPEEIRHQLPQQVLDHLAKTYRLVEPPESPQPNRRTFRRPRVPVTSRDLPSELRIEHPWFNGCLVICLLIACPYVYYETWQTMQTSISWGLLGLLLCLALTYYALASVVNHTLIEVKDGYLRTSHHPLPWFFARKIPISDITQLVTRYHYSRNSSHYRVYVITRSRRTIMLLEYVDTEGEARSIERAIERHLGIEDWQ